MKELASQINSILQYIMLYSILRNIYRFDSLTDLQASTIKILIITNVLWFFIAYIFFRPPRPKLYFYISLPIIIISCILIFILEFLVFFP